MNHADAHVSILLAFLTASILGGIFVSRKLSSRGRSLFIRRIPGLAALDEAVGRATEMGRPILFSLGLGSLDIVSLQALAILNHVTRIAAKYGSRVIVPTADSVLFTLAEEVSREAYAGEDAADRYDPDDVRYLTDNQFAYASGVVGILTREKVASACYFGSFYAESLVLAETGHHVGAVQVAGTPSTTQIPFFLAACDYTIIGDEFYAASAYLSREPAQLGPLKAQDYGKLVIILVIVAGILALTLFQWDGILQLVRTPV